jgi:hypothetical protein
LFGVDWVFEPIFEICSLIASLAVGYLQTNLCLCSESKSQSFSASGKALQINPLTSFENLHVQFKQVNT